MPTAFLPSSSSSASQMFYCMACDVDVTYLNEEDQFQCPHPMRSLALLTQILMSFEVLF